MQAITTFLTFETGGKQAVELYLSVFKNSKLNAMMALPGSDQLMHASFTLDGQDFMAMDGGPEFSFAQGTSLFVSCQTQDEVDYYCDKLTAGGGEQGRCGWLKDRFGVSWQIVPTALGELMQSSDPAQSQRVMQAMLSMNKLDIQGLRDAAAASE